MITAIVYTSNTGTTQEYAHFLAHETKLPVYSFAEAKKQLDRNSEIIYLGWVMADNIKGYKKADKIFKIKALCAVGMMSCGDMKEEISKANELAEDISLFTLQGGFDIHKLHGLNKLIMKFMAGLIVKEILSKENKTEQDIKKAHAMQYGGSFVCKENLKDVLAWYRQHA